MKSEPINELALEDQFENERHLFDMFLDDFIEKQIHLLTEARGEVIQQSNHPLQKLT